MAIEHVKSTPVSNLDATPVVPNTAGVGAQNYVREVTGSLTVPASASIDSTFRFVRVPTNAAIKRIRLTSQTQAAGAIDIGVYYPTIGKTGLPDLAANAIDQDFFASALVLTTAYLTPIDVTNEAGTYTADKWNQPLWQALGLTSDPGGFFDIVGTVTTAITTGTGIAGLSVEHTTS